MTKPIPSLETFDLEPGIKTLKALPARFSVKDFRKSYPGTHYWALNALCALEHYGAVKSVRLEFEKVPGWFMPARYRPCYADPNHEPIFPYGLSE